MSEQLDFKWKGGKILIEYDETHKRYVATFFYCNNTRYIYTRNDEPVWNRSGEAGLNARKEVFLKLLNKIEKHLKK